MEFLKIFDNLRNPQNQNLEVVERKGIGHPDTLADALAESISITYSRYCLEQFGSVLHHNLDKLYVGGGLFEVGYGFSRRKKPIRIVINGRISDSFGGLSIDITALQNQAMSEYLKGTMPHVRPEDISVICNSTQHTRFPNWFSPRDLDDLPERGALKANDTSVCVSYWPPTLCERLVYGLESFFWSDRAGLPVPNDSRIGQDIKVMAVRENDEVKITACVPLICTQLSSESEYYEHIERVRRDFDFQARNMAEGSSYRVTTSVNPHKPYILGVGTCAEFGEEGLVGRGNGPNGVISVFRPHSAEAPAGKNPVYHTGRVLGHLTSKLAKSIHTSFGVACSVLAMTQNGGTLIPPYLLSISLSKMIDRQLIVELVERDIIEADYISEILSTRVVR